MQNIGDSNKITVFIIKQSNKIQKIFVKYNADIKKAAFQTREYIESCIPHVKIQEVIFLRELGTTFFSILLNMV